MTPGRRALAVVVLLAGLGGCGPKFWNKPGATLEDFNRDSAACSKEATTQYGIFVDDVYRACLHARGWVRASQFEPPPPGWYRGIE
jgi:hypothetical protein